MRFQGVFRNEPDSFLNKGKWLIILSCIFPVVFMVVYSRFLPSRCEVFKSKKIDGIILDKYLDPKNHNCMTILMTSPNGKAVERPLEFQDTILFKNIKVHDRLEKQKGQNFYVINQLDTIKHICID